MIERACHHCGENFTVASMYSNRKHCTPECRFRTLLPNQFADACVDWPLSRNKETGYGQFNPGDGMVGAHRMSFEAFIRPLCKGESVLHSCDNRACVNPRHLFVGTQADNIADMWTKGRQQRYVHQPRGDSNPARAMPERLARGERQGSAKLTADKVRAIMLSDAPHTHLARLYGVDPSSIAHVRQGKTWRHVTQAALPPA